MGYFLQRQADGFASNGVSHTETIFWNLIKSKRNQILFTMHRLIWNSKWIFIWLQINRKMVNRIWFRFDSKRFRKNVSVCAGPRWNICNGQTYNQPRGSRLIRGPFEGHPRISRQLRQCMVLRDLRGGSIETPNVVNTSIDIIRL